MKLLIFAPDAFSIFQPESRYIFGGVEIETGYYAKGLAEFFNVQVSVITKDQGVKKTRTNYLEIIPHPVMKGPGYWKKRASLLGRLKQRFLAEKATEVDLIKSIDPDIIYIQGMSKDALRLARFSKEIRKKFIFRVASDMDLGNAESNLIKMPWSGISYEEACEVYNSAGVVMVQTTLQQQLLEERFNRKSDILLNPIDTEEFNPDPSVRKDIDVLWIGKSSAVKRPELFIEAAKALPNYKFTMVLNKLDESMWNDLNRQLPGNVTLIESIPVTKVKGLFQRTRLFVNTSIQEGFANTFLQAGSCAVPIISMTQDPNGMLGHFGAGVLCGDTLNELKDTIEQLLQNPEKLASYGEKARNYVLAHHDHRIIVKRFQALLS